MEVIYALLLRKLKHNFRSRVRIIASLMQPAMYLLTMGYGLGWVFRDAGQGSYLDFLTPGMIGMSVMLASFSSAVDLIVDRQVGCLKPILVAPVSRFKLVAGFNLGGSVIATIQGMLLLGLALIAGFDPGSWQGIATACGIMLLLALLFSAFGTLIATHFGDMQTFQLTINFVITPVFFLSGGMFPLQNAPSVLVTLVQLNPLAYGVDGLRIAMEGAGYFSMQQDMLVLSISTAVLFACGWRSFARMQD